MYRVQNGNYPYFPNMDSLERVMEIAGEQAIFMHCLPAFHDLKTKIGSQIGEKFGIDAMEANSISGQFDGVIYTVGAAIATATSVMVGQN